MRTAHLAVRGTRRHPARRLLAAAIALATGALALAGCGGGGGTGSGGGGTISVGVPPVVELGDLYVADARGYFKDHGLTVKIHNISGGAQLVPALQSNSLQMGQSNLVSVLQAQQQKLDVKCFSGAYTSPSRPELAMLVSPKDAASVASPAQLAGRTIAVNTLSNSNQLVAQAYLSRHGLDPAKVRFVAVGYEDMPAALRSGRVAAAITDEPFTTLARQQGSRLLVAQPDAAIAPHPAYPCWVAGGSWLDKNKDRAARFVAALSRADSYMHAHPAYLRSILPKYTSVPAKTADAVVLPEFTTSLDAADIAPWSAAAAKFHITHGKVDPSSILQIVKPAGK